MAEQTRNKGRFPGKQALSNRSLEVSKSIVSPPSMLVGQKKLPLKSPLKSDTLKSARGGLKTLGYEFK